GATVCACISGRSSCAYCSSSFAISGRRRRASNEEGVLMVDILLAHSYFLKYDAKQQQKMRPYPPLATLYAASLLRSRGSTVALFDAMLADGEHEFAQALERHQPRFVVLYEDNFNFLSKMCLSRMRDAACHMSELAREAGVAVIAAGS